MIEDKVIYESIHRELLHRHDCIWKTRQIFITLFIAIRMIVHKYPNFYIGISLLPLLLGATLVMLIVDYRYQKKKIYLLRQLYVLESLNKIPDNLKIGSYNEGIGHFYWIYIILLTAIFSSFVVPMVEL